MSGSRSFEYLVCIDFEATCWDQDLSVALMEEKREIIEFGAVLLNIRTGAIESEFHDYVRPTNNPILSDYCKNLTGISQTLVDQQQPFPVVYQQFNNWLVGIRAAKQLKFATPHNRSGNNANTTLCTWTNFDLGTFLKWDCDRLGITRPDYLRAWIDARKTFQNNCHSKCKFEQALAHMNIIRTGNAHSAIDDAKMLAKLMTGLNQRGARINAVTTYDFDEY